MTTPNFVILCIAIVLCVLIIALLMRTTLLTRRQEAQKKAIVKHLLELAQQQNELFDFKLDDPSIKYGLSAVISSISDNELHLEVDSYIAKQWVGTHVDIYFRISMPEGPIFYKFHSTIKAIKAQRKRSSLTLVTPTDLTVGQKRNFIRVKPKKDMVRVIGVWHMDPHNPIPKSTAEIGRPIMHYKLGMESEPVQVENISGSGMALRFFAESADSKPVDLDKGSQLLCLVVYSVDKTDKLITFWCVCEVVNARMMDEGQPAFMIGLEFTNWAVLEQGKSEISWFHSSPTKGVGPITQWVMRIDMEQRKLT